MRHKGGTIAAAALVALAAVPAFAQDPGQTAREIEEASRELVGARAGLDELTLTVSEAEHALSVIERDLDERSAELFELEAELADARAVEAEAVAEALAISRDLAAADEQLDALVGQWTTHRRVFEDRITSAYKHGAGAAAGTLFGVLLEAQSLHDAAVTTRALDKVLRDDRDLVENASDLAVSAAHARRDVAVKRAEAVATRDATARARAKVQRLVDRQQGLIDSIEEERTGRAQILGSFEQDRDRQLALIDELTRRVGALQARLAAELAESYADGVFDPASAPNWVNSLPAHARTWVPHIVESALRHGIDPRLFASLVWAESNFHPGAVSHAGAIGLSQLMPFTAQRLGVDPWNPIQNLEGGARYLAAQHATFGRWDLALAAYNAGPGAVQRYGGIPPYAETQFYVLRVLGLYENLVTADLPPPSVPPSVPPTEPPS